MMDEILKSKSGPLGFNYRNFTSPTGHLINANINQANAQVYRQKKRDRDSLKDDLTVLEIHKDEQKKILMDYGQPKGLWMGLAVLVYACLVGVVYPSTLLPYPKNIYNDEDTKWLLLGLFFSQLLFLFIYLGYYMYILTKEEKE